MEWAKRETFPSHVARYDVQIQRLPMSLPPSSLRMTALSRPTTMDIVIVHASSAPGSWDLAHD